MMASVFRLAASAAMEASANARFSAKLNASVHNEFDSLKIKTKFTSAKLVKGVILQVKKDILDDKNAAAKRRAQDVLSLAE